MQVNQPAPDFELPDLESRRHRLSDYLGRIVIVNFWSCECPHVDRTDRSIMTLYAQRAADIALLPIAPNVIESEAAIASVARARGLPVVLLDRQHLVADLYQALTTPEVFVVDRAGILRYRGAVDDVNFGQRTPTRFFLNEVVEALLAGRLPALAETRAFGCAIVREAVE